MKTQEKSFHFSSIVSFWIALLLECLSELTDELSIKDWTSCSTSDLMNPSQSQMLVLKFTILKNLLECSIDSHKHVMRSFHPSPSFLVVLNELSIFHCYNITFIFYAHNHFSFLYYMTAKTKCAASLFGFFTRYWSKRNIASIRHTSFVVKTIFHSNSISIECSLLKRCWLDDIEPTWRNILWKFISFSFKASVYVKRIYWPIDKSIWSSFGLTFHF